MSSGRFRSAARLAFVDALVQQGLVVCNEADVVAEAFDHVLERLGGGGMGVVYKAVDTRLDRPVALKFLPPELTRDDEARRRFVQEAKAASALDHPNICTIYEIDSTPEGQLFIVMSFIDGETLKKRIDRGRLPIEEAIDIATQVGQGLAKAHSAGIIHRDIKPANLMISRDGVVKIVDFGIAKLTGQTGPTRTGTTLGTVAYMAPEQIEGAEAKPRTDLWALGVVLYEMLTGRPSFSGEQPVAVMNAIVGQTPAPIRTIRPDVPDDLERVVKRALEKKPESRHGSATDLARELAACRIRLTGILTSQRTSLGAALRTPRIAVAAGVLALAGIAGAWSLLGGDREARWARQEGLPEIRRLIAADQNVAAFALAERVARVIPDDPQLDEIWPQVTANISIDTTPPGAEVRIREYQAAGGEWTNLGATPIKDRQVPRGVFRIQVSREGSETVERLVNFQVTPNSERPICSRTRKLVRHSIAWRPTVSAASSTKTRGPFRQS